MFIWALAASAAALFLLIVLILYRRQIRLICRRLLFFRSHKTNMRLTADLPLSELNELTDRINEIIDLSKEVRRNSRQNETRLKETITNLSHDIRTPLTSMDGYFQLLLQSDSEEERRRYIAIIQTRIGSLRDMLEELFTYTRLQDEDYTLETETMDFGQCVYHTLFSFYEEFLEKGIVPENCFCDGRILIRGNEEAVRRTLQNLIKNALVHGRSHIRLELFSVRGRIGFRCSNDVLHPENIDIRQVFDRFYKADTARTKASTGLGLSIAKGLTERMGGSVSAALDGHMFVVEISFPEIDPYPVI